MREPGEFVTASFPRPGRTLKGVLIAVAVLGVLGAVIVNYVPGPPLGEALFAWLAFQPSHLLRLWTLLTSGLLTSPTGISHALWSLVGLYFLTTDLERRWGGARVLRFLAAAVVFGNLAVLLVTLLLPGGHPIFHPPIVFGPFAAIAATAIAWGKENGHRQIRLFFFLPISGRTLYWLTIGLAILSLVFLQGAPEGAVAPLGGIAAGVLLGGTPSPFRAAWLRIKLAFLRRRSGGGFDIESVLHPERTRTTKARSRGGPSLRVVKGGADDDHRPPTDKRYLN
ncbi:MAG: rhomboid family intramembrane serine protease [Polyangiaceae bacterium]|nr:rhomboid family intramembrane serine protease [Polyangiaceae bacterium]